MIDVLFDFKNPDYQAVYKKRAERLHTIRTTEGALAGLLEFYKTHPAEFINDWGMTFDPRNAERGLPTNFPFVLFPKQIELVNWVVARWKSRDDGVIEKSRDIGMTWLAAAIAHWVTFFHPGTVVGFGSRKEDLVDKNGDPDSIFWKIQAYIAGLPIEFRPKDQTRTHLCIVNNDNGSVIKGEAGDNIGRGGRSSLFFKDEALILSSKVLTSNGWVLMGDLTMNDKVIGIDGTEKDITHINDCGEFETYSVTFSDGTVVECSPNHLWTVNEVIGKRKTVTVRTNEMYERYKYTSPQGKILYRYRMPLIAPINFEKRELPLHPYVVGALIGDGGVSQVPKSSPKLTSIDEDLVDYFKSKLPDYCSFVREKEGISYRLNDVRGRMGWKHKSRIRQAVVDVGIAGKRSWEKFIPAAYKYSSIEDRLALLQGLMDTDGSAGKSGGSAAYYTSSKMLADDVRFLAESLGGYATMKIKKDKRGYRDQYVLFIILPAEFEPFILKRKLDIYKIRNNTIERSIICIEKTGRKEPVRCISINSDDGLYITEGCIPTHNSAHYERQELIDAALSATSNCKIDMSSVNGNGNLFYRKRMGGEIPVFSFHWSDDPRKDKEWYEKKKRTVDPVLFAQEYDLDYNASTNDSWIPGDFVEEAMKLGPADVVPIGGWVIGIDAAHMGDDESVIHLRRGRLNLKQITRRKLDGIQLAGLVTELCGQLELQGVNGRIDAIIIELDGPGASCYDQLRDGRYKKIIYGVHTGATLADGRNYNLRARMWRDAMDYLKNGGVSVYQDRDFKSQLCSVKYKYKDSLLLMQSKKEYKKEFGRSPDRADAFVLTFAVRDIRPVQDQFEQVARHNIRRQSDYQGY